MLTVELEAPACAWSLRVAVWSKRPPSGCERSLSRRSRRRRTLLPCPQQSQPEAARQYRAAQSSTLACIKVALLCRAHGLASRIKRRFSR